MTAFRYSPAPSVDAEMMDSSASSSTPLVKPKTSSTPASASPALAKVAGKGKDLAHDDKGRLQNAMLAEWYQNKRDKSKRSSEDPAYGS